MFEIFVVFLKVIFALTLAGLSVGAYLLAGGREKWKDKSLRLLDVSATLMLCIGLGIMLTNVIK